MRRAYSRLLLRQISSISGLTDINNTPSPSPRGTPVGSLKKELIDSPTKASVDSPVKDPKIANGIKSLTDFSLISSHKMSTVQIVEEASSSSSSSAVEKGSSCLLAGAAAEAAGNDAGGCFFLLIYMCNFYVLHHFLLIYICKLHLNLTRYSYSITAFRGTAGSFSS